MPPRRQAPRRAQPHELEAFAEKYETLALIYGDPVETVFNIMAKQAAAGGDDEITLRAAEMLISYRFPRIKAAEDSGKNSGPALNFYIDTGGVHPVREINPPTIDMDKMLGGAVEVKDG
jgi:hypothetical protein